MECCSTVLPLIDKGLREFSDSWNGKPIGLRTWRVPVYYLPRVSANLDVSYKSNVLKTDTGCHDGEFFGDAPREALVRARNFIKDMEGCNVDIRIHASIQHVPVLADNTASDVEGAQAYVDIPDNWSCVGPEALLVRNDSFVLWENGRATDGLGCYLELVRKYVAQDKAPNRNGKLRSILSPDFGRAPEELLDL